MTEARTIEQHGSRIIAALEHAWAAIQDQHPDVPDAVIITGPRPARKAHLRATSCAGTTGGAGPVIATSRPALHQRCSPTIPLPREHQPREYPRPRVTT
jgi:hypothetical protein